MRCFPCLLLAAGLAPFGSAKTTCSKIDIDSRRSADQGIGITIDARKWVNCDEVDLSITSALDSDNKLLAAGAQELSRYIGVSQRLKRLKLTGNFIGDEGAAYIAAGLSSNSVLESLWLGRNNISDTGLSAIMEALENNQQLRELKLDFNSIHSTDSVYNTIDPAQSISGLQHIDLTGNRLDDDSAFLLLNAAPLENQQVQQLMLGLNQITDVGAAGIADVLATDPPSLTGLWLDGNNISDVGAEALALSLRNNSHIEKLSLTGNEGYFGQWGDAVRVQLSLGTEQRVDGKGDFDCISHVSQPFSQYVRETPVVKDTLASCQQECRQLQRPACAGVEWSSETKECWIAPYASSSDHVSDQLVDMPMHYVCDNTGVETSVLSSSEL